MKVYLFITALVYLWSEAQTRKVVWTLPLDQAKVVYHHQRICLNVKGVENCIKKDKEPGDPQELAKMFSIVHEYETDTDGDDDDDVAPFNDDDAIDGGDGGGDDDDDEGANKFQGSVEEDGPVHIPGNDIPKGLQDEVDGPVYLPNEEAKSFQEVVDPKNIDGGSGEGRRY